MLGMIQAYQAAVVPPPPGAEASSGNMGPAGANGSITPGSAHGSATASPTVASTEGEADRGVKHTGEVDLLVGSLLDAIQKTHTCGTDVFGPLMILAVKNDEGNLRKARTAWQKLAEDAQRPPEGITLRWLLETERSSGCHKPGAILMDPSAAVALLWMRRTLQFLTRCLEGIYSERPMNECAIEAYQMELEPFHGWLLKSTFAVALNGFPNRDEIFVRIGAHLPEERREALLRVEVDECIGMLKQVVDSMRSLFEELGLEDMRKV